MFILLLYLFEEHVTCNIFFIRKMCLAKIFFLSPKQHNSLFLTELTPFSSPCLMNIYVLNIFVIIIIIIINHHNRKFPSDNEKYIYTYNFSFRQMEQEEKLLHTFFLENFMTFWFRFLISLEKLQVHQCYCRTFSIGAEVSLYWLYYVNGMMYYYKEAWHFMIYVLHFHLWLLIYWYC